MANRRSQEAKSDGIQITPLTDIRDESGKRISALFHEEWDTLSVKTLTYHGSINSIPDRYLSQVTIHQTQDPVTWKDYKGFFFSILSSIIFASTLWIVQKLQQEYDPITIALWRLQGVFLPSAIMVIGKLLDRKRKSSFSLGAYKFVGGREILADLVGEHGIKIVWKKFGLVSIRALLSCNSILLYFFCLKYLTLGDAAIVSTVTPIFTYAFAFFWFEESCGIIPGIVAVTSFCGIAIITRPPQLTLAESVDRDALMGVSIGVASALLTALGLTVLRCVRRVHHSYITFALGAFGSVEHLLLAVFIGVFSFPQNMEAWIYASALAVLCFLGQLALVSAFKLENKHSGLVIVMKTFDLIFGFGTQLFLSGIIPDMWSWIGGGIVFFGLILLGVHKWIESLPVDNALERRFWFFQM